MTYQVTSRSTTRRILPARARKLIVGVVAILSFAAALVLQQTWWTLFLMVEFILAVGAVELLGRNLPKRLRRQIKSNSRRSDGSRSEKRSAIERESIGRFKSNTLLCFAFTLIPMHTCWLTYCFFLPQIIRFNEAVELSAKNKWMEILLEPAIHILVLVSLFMSMAYGFLKGIYFRTLKELDDEVCRRAENYAAYDLVHPPENPKHQPKSA